MRRVIINLIRITKKLQGGKISIMKIIKKTLKILIFIAIYYPIIDLSLIYSFSLRAMIKLGRFPKYNDPDPKDLGFDEHYDFVYSNYFELTLSPQVCKLKSQGMDL